MVFAHNLFYIMRSAIRAIKMPLSEMKHLRCRCLGGMTLYPQKQLSTIPQTQQLQMCIQDFCTAVCFSYAIKSQSVLTTNSTGRVYNVQFECRAQHSMYTSEIASIACLHSFFRHTLLSCNLSASRQSTVDSFVYGEL